MFFEFTILATTVDTRVLLIRAGALLSVVAGFVKKAMQLLLVDFFRLIGHCKQVVGKGEVGLDDALCIKSGFNRLFAHAANTRNPKGSSNRLIVGFLSIAANRTG